MGTESVSHVHLTTRNMWDFISESSLWFENVTDMYGDRYPPQGYSGDREDLAPEYVFEIKEDTMDNTVIRWKTTIRETDGQARSKGDDVMKVFIIHTPTDYLLAPPTRVLRIQSWRENLTDAISQYQKTAWSPQRCPHCSRPLILYPPREQQVDSARNSQYWVCSNVFSDQSCIYTALFAD